MEQAYDIMGNELNEGDYIVVPYTKMISVLTVAKIIRFTPKTVRIAYVRAGKINKERNIAKLPEMYNKISKEQVTMYILAS